MALFLASSPRLAGFPDALPRLRQRHVICRTEKAITVLTITAPQLFEDVIADGFTQELLAAAAQLGPCDVVLDLKHVKAVTGAAIRALAELRAFIHKRGRRLVLSGVCPCVAETFHLARMVEADAPTDLLFPMQPDLASAIAFLVRSR